MAGLKLTVLVLNLFATCLALDNLIDTLKANNATTLIQLIDQAGLTDTLKTGGPYTIIAPTNDAFSKIPASDLQNLQGDMNTLKNVLQYHVVNGEVFTWDLRTGEHLTTITGHQIRVYSTPTGGHYFNQGAAVKEEIQASNGVIYLVDEVLDVPEGTVLDILHNPAYNLSYFANIVHRAGMDRIFNTTTTTARYTLFVPSDLAFNNLPADIRSRLTSSSTYSRYIAQYHTHRGTLHLKSFSTDGHITTMYAGHLITLSHDQSTGEALLNTLAHLTLADIEAENGVVHVISHVLIPSTLAAIVG